MTKKILLIFSFVLCLFSQAYSNPSTCQTAMDSLSFKNFKNSLTKHSFDDAKINEMELAISKKCFSSEQISQLLKLLSFEEDKLKIARKAFLHVMDPSNFGLVLNAFTFEVSKNEIRQLMSSPKK